MILDGKKVRGELLNDLKEKIKGKNIGLAIIYVGDNDASDVYIKQKINTSHEVGIEPYLYKLGIDASKEELITLIEKLNNDDSIHGIILQSPIPKHLDFDYCSNKIIASKDVDGFTKENVYLNYINSECLLPCTVKGIIKLLDYYNISVSGKEVVIVGRGNIVGKPLSLALENRDATVTLAHSKTLDLARVCKRADILISAVGHSNLINRDYVKKGAVVIDVGINRVNGKLCGDVDYLDVKDIASYITPVPGGVGPMTVICLMENTYEAYLRLNNN